MDNIELSKTVGQRINEQLATQEKKQKDLAQYLGVRDNIISYFCSGTRIPNTEQVKKIAEFFNVSADYLLGITKHSISLKTEEGETIRSICDYTGLSDIVIDRMFNNTKKNNPYNLAYLLNTIGNNTKTIKDFYFLVSHIVEFEVAAKRYYDLLAYCEIEKDEQLLNSLILQADSLKERMEIKQFRIEKEYRNLIEELIQIGDWDNGNNTQEE